MLLAGRAVEERVAILVFSSETFDMIFRFFHSVEVESSFEETARCQILRKGASRAPFLQEPIAGERSKQDGRLANPQNDRAVGVLSGTSIPPKGPPRV